MYNGLRLSNDQIDEKLFICCERNDAFQIKMEAVDKYENNKNPPTYGVVLYLNG